MRKIKTYKSNTLIYCYALSALEYIGGMIGASIMVILAMSIIEF